MFKILLLLLTIVPAIEIYLLFSIGSQIGGFKTLIVIILTGIVGAALAKFQGLSILYKIQKNLQRGLIPTEQFLNGLLVLGGGLLLLTPGFLTDIFGLAMILPGSRAIISSLLKKIFAKAISSGNFNFTFFGNKSFDNYNETSIENEMKTTSEGKSNTIEAKFKKK